MSTDDDVDLGRSGIDIKLLNVVQNVNQCRTSLDSCRHGQLGGPIALVDISPNRDHRRYSAQSFDDSKVAYIARMDDQIGSSERGQRLRTEEAMRVRDQSYRRNITRFS
jgi:hypothetical protein